MLHDRLSFDLPLDGIFKLIAKIPANELTPFLDLLVDGAFVAFIDGQDVWYDFLGAYEMSLLITNSAIEKEILYKSDLKKTCY